MNVRQVWTSSADVVDEFASCSGDIMHREAIMAELSRVEREVVQGERQLAEQEALLVDLRRQNFDLTKARAVLEMMHKNQLRRDPDRQRLLSLLQPLDTAALRKKHRSNDLDGAGP